jgi:trehalose-phosphatase
MQHLFAAWDRVRSILKDAEHILLLSDYDGTLTPIVERPEMANLSEDTRKVLRLLAKNPRYTVGIISGRALADLKSRVGLEGIVYAGNHGLEIEGIGSSYFDPVAEEVRPFLNLLSNVLSATLRGIRGVFVENKGLTLSVHYRAVDENEEEVVANTFRKVVEPLHTTGKIRVTQGKKVYEIRPPVDWDKGKAIMWLLEKCRQLKRKSDVLPVYLGDDLTDEDGFRAIEKNGGISILVCDELRQSLARYFVTSPEEAVAFLKKLL